MRDLTKIGMVAALALCVAALLLFVTGQLSWAGSDGASEPAQPDQAPANEAPDSAALAGYLDQPQTPGDWSYTVQADGGSAVFANSEEMALFTMRCTASASELTIERAATTGSGDMAITTETAAQALPTKSRADGSAVHSAQLAADDPLLDAMAITKGRFAVAMEGEDTLYLPAWVEVSRVIEDCR